MGLIKTKTLRMNKSLLLLAACLSVVSAHGNHCRCGASQQVCRKHQWMILAMLGMFLSYMYMYAGYYWQKYCAYCFKTEELEEHEEEELDVVMKADPTEHVKTCTDAQCTHCENFDMTNFCQKKEE